MKSKMEKKKGVCRKRALREVELVRLRERGRTLRARRLERNPRKDSGGLGARQGLRRQGLRGFARMMLQPVQALRSPTGWRGGIWQGGNSASPNSAVSPSVPSVPEPRPEAPISEAVLEKQHRRPHAEH